MEKSRKKKFGKIFVLLKIWIFQNVFSIIQYWSVKRWLQIKILIHNLVQSGCEKSSNTELRAPLLRGSFVYTNQIKRSVVVVLAQWSWWSFACLLSNETRESMWYKFYQNIIILSQKNPLVCSVVFKIILCVVTIACV